MLQWPSKDAETSKCFQIFTHPSTSGMPVTQDHFCSINANQVHSILKEIYQIGLIFINICALCICVFMCANRCVGPTHLLAHTVSWSEFV